MKYFLSFTEWVKKREVHAFIAAWVVIALITTLLAVSRIFYSTDIQTVGYGGFSFEGEIQKDGICYTVKSIPEGSDVEIGEQAIIEEGSELHITYRNQRYISDDTLTSKNKIFVTFPDQTRYLFIAGSDGSTGIWADAENLGNLVSAMTKKPPSSWQPDLIPALHYANETFRENYENPKVWNPQITFMALLCFLAGTASAFLPRLLGELGARRNQRVWYDSDAEIKPSQRLINWTRGGGWICILLGFVVLCWSFYF